MSHEHDWTEIGRAGLASGELHITESCGCGVERHRVVDRDEE